MMGNECIRVRSEEGPTHVGHRWEMEMCRAAFGRGQAAAAKGRQGKSGHLSFRFSPLFSKVDATLPSRVGARFVGIPSNRDRREGRIGDGPAGGAGLMRAE